MNLGTQLAVSALLVVLMTLIHALGVIGATKLLRLEDRSLRAHRVNAKAFGLLISIALWLFALHMIEVTIFGLFYLGVGAMADLEEALYFSATSYTTLGHPTFAFPEAWRLVGAIEGLVGFLLIGWSTAVFITDMNKLLREGEVKDEEERAEKGAKAAGQSGALAGASTE